MTEKKISIDRTVDNPKEYKEEFKEIIEELAALEHEQWITWSQSIANDMTVILSDEQLARWKASWVPYSELTEEMKEQDRVWARKSLTITLNGLINIEVTNLKKKL